MLCAHKHATAHTELVHRNDCAKEKFDIFMIATEVYRLLPASFTLQSASFKRSCATEFGMSALSEVNQHIFSNSVPLCRACTCWCRTIVVQSQVRGMSDDHVEIFLRNLIQFWNSEYTRIFVSDIFPFNVVEH